MLKPYNLVPFRAGHCFTTASRRCYYLYFTDVSETFGGAPVYSFGFELISGEKCLLQDKRIAQTICKALDNFLHENDHVIIYVPLDRDGKEASRVRLFDQWFSRYSHDFTCKEIEKDRVIFKYDNEKDLVVTVFFKTPQRAVVKKVLYDDLFELWTSSKE